MEISENLSEDLVTGDLFMDEINISLKIGIENIDFVGDQGISFLGDDIYHVSPTDLTTLVSSGCSKEKCNEFTIQEEGHSFKSNYADVELRNQEIPESKNDNLDNELTFQMIDKKDNTSDHEELSKTIFNKNEEGNIIWDDQRPKFECNECSYGTKKKYLLNRHRKIHSNDMPHESIYINNGKINDETAYNPGGDRFNIEKPFATIAMEGGNKDDDYEQDRTFACNECAYNTDKKYLLTRHAKTHSVNRPYNCKICERGFTTRNSMQSHVNMHYGIKNQICKYCERSFTTSGEMSRHIKYIHTHEKPHKCTECDYAAVERSKLQRHFRCHTGERPYQCQHCTYASQDTYKLKRHLRTHTGEKPYKCDICSTSYAHSTSLKLHKLVHDPTQKKVLSCDYCPAKKPRKSELRQHIQKMHFSDKPLKCKRCDKIFSDLYSYRLHSKTHKNEKCFKCQLCPFAAKKFSHLKTHMMTHTGKKPINCDLCEEYFISNSFLRRHQYLCHNKTYALREKSYKCQNCKRAFAYKACLIRHQAVHEEDLNNLQE